MTLRSPTTRLIRFAANVVESFLLVRPPEDEGTPVPSGEQLREMRLLLLEEGHCFRDQALSFCKMQSSPPREILDASSLSTLVQMVSAGMGVTLIPEMALAVETRSAPVSVASFSEPPLVWGWQRLPRSLASKHRLSRRRMA